MFLSGGGEICNIFCLDIHAWEANTPLVSCFYLLLLVFEDNRPVVAVAFWIDVLGATRLMLAPELVIALAGFMSGLGMLVWLQLSEISK